MDIPVRFKFFDKLKLYQDYLKKDSMLEKTKKIYWLFGKSILFWAYSNDHQHLQVPLDVDTFKKRADDVSAIAKQVGGDSYDAINWVASKSKDNNKVIRVLGNLTVMELANKLDPRQGDSLNSDPLNLNITISPKGFLLGELLFETFEKPGFWSKNFRKYKFALLVFYITFVIIILTVYGLFIEQFLQLIKPEDLAIVGKEIVMFIGNSWWSITSGVIILYLVSRYVWQKL